VISCDPASVSYGCHMTIFHCRYHFSQSETLNTTYMKVTWPAYLRWWGRSLA